MLLWLAAKFGVWDVEGFAASLSGAEFQEWVAFYGVKSEYEQDAMKSK